MKTEYKLTPSRKVFFGVGSLLFLILFGRALYDLSLLEGFTHKKIDINLAITTIIHIVPPLIFVIFSGIMALALLHKILFDPLAISEDGITYHTVGQEIRSKWSNLKRLYTPGFLGIATGICVMPENIKNLFRHNVTWFVLKNKQGEIFIPLYMFDSNWHDSELGQQIKQYAPHLFQ